MVASLTYRAGFLDRPIVDEDVEILWAAMSRLWPTLRRRALQPRTVMSCYVDSPFAHSGGLKTLARRFAGDLLKRRAPGLAGRNLRGGWRARRYEHAADPHCAAIDWIMDVNLAAGRAVAFYFIPENTDQHLDNRVSLDDPRMRALLREIHARGHEIGIHPGYNPYRHPEALARSVATLRRVLAAEGIDPPQLAGLSTFCAGGRPPPPACGTTRAWTMTVP